MIGTQLFITYRRATHSHICGEKRIGSSTIDTVNVGAAIVHCHVRDPETGAPSRDLTLYREITERIRDADVD